MRNAIALAAVALAATAHAEPEIPRAEIDLGRKIYQQHCAACHGAAGEGQPGWERLNPAGELPAPPHDDTGHTWKHSDAMLYRIVAQGFRDPFNKTQRLTMPGFSDRLAPHEIRAVIQYLKTLWSPEHRQFQREESRNQPFPALPKEDRR